MNVVNLYIDDEGQWWRLTKQKLQSFCLSPAFLTWLGDPQIVLSALNALNDPEFNYSRKVLSCKY